MQKVIVLVSIILLAVFGCKKDSAEERDRAKLDPRPKLSKPIYFKDDKVNLCYTLNAEAEYYSVIFGVKNDLRHVVLLSSRARKSGEEQITVNAEYADNQVQSYSYLFQVVEGDRIGAVFENLKPDDVKRAVPYLHQLNETLPKEPTDNPASLDYILKDHQKRGYLAVRSGIFSTFPFIHGQYIYYFGKNNKLESVGVFNRNIEDAEYWANFDIKRYYGEGEFHTATASSDAFYEYRHNGYIIRVKQGTSDFVVTTITKEK